MIVVFFFETLLILFFFFFFSSRRRHTRSLCDWSSDVCSSDLLGLFVRAQWAPACNLALAVAPSGTAPLVARRNAGVLGGSRQVGGLVDAHLPGAAAGQSEQSSATPHALYCLLCRARRRVGARKAAPADKPASPLGMARRRAGPRCPPVSRRHVPLVLVHVRFSS